MDNNEFDEEGIVTTWMNVLDNKLKQGLTTIDIELEEVNGAINNERIWVNGSVNHEQSLCHINNIATLTEYINRIKNKYKGELSE